MGKRCIAAKTHNQLTLLRRQSAEIILDIREGAGRPVERSESRIVMPETPAIGIKPLFEGDTVAENAEARFSLLALGPDMTPASTPVRWVLNRIQTDYQWYSVGGQWSWEVITTRERVTEGVAEPGAAPAEIAAPVQWGQYEIVAEPASGQGGQSSVEFYAGWGAVASSGTETPDRLQVVLDQPAYRSGDTARFRLERAAPMAGSDTVPGRLAGIGLRRVDATVGER